MKKIAILDDYDDFCVVMECLLGSYFEVSGFTDTSLFLEKVKTEKYTVALIDLSIKPIPGGKIKDGCDLIQYLKENLPEPPLMILFSGWFNKNDLDEAKNICPIADSFLPKDSDLENILAEINRLITVSH